MEYDVVIVGAGSAGSVLANRLSKDPGRRVAVLEAGGSGDRHPYVSMPRGVGKLMAMPSHMWFYLTEPHAHTGMRPDVWLRGKGLGGSSSVNGMVWVRGQPADFDALAELAGDDWRWEHIARAYEAIEGHELGPAPSRGGSGPVGITLPTFRNELTEAINAAGEQMGWPVKQDVNTPDAGDGIGYMPRSIRRGRRQSAALAFLRPAMRRPNLTVIPNAIVDRVLFDGNRVTGVEFLHGSQRQTITAGEVILCAGAVASPGILERSGIGDPSVLGPLGIPIVHANPAVGAEVSEHRALRMQWRLKRPLSLNRDYSGLRLWRNVARYYLTGDGPMAAAAIDMRAAFRSREGLERPDIQVQFGMYSWDISAPGGGLEPEHGFCAVFYPLRPRSNVGTIHIRSRDPQAAPVIEAGYGADAADRATTVAATHLLRRFAAQEPLASLVEAETLPGPDALSDDSILAALDQFGCAGMHTVGSCRMGRDAGSVVDPLLRVRGVQGLRVIDTSVFPVIPSGNTNAPTLALAWRAAEVIAGPNGAA